MSVLGNSDQIKKIAFYGQKIFCRGHFLLTLLLLTGKRSEIFSQNFFLLQTGCKGTSDQIKNIVFYEQKIFCGGHFVSMLLLFTGKRSEIFSQFFFCYRVEYKRCVLEKIRFLYKESFLQGILSNKDVSFNNTDKSVWTGILPLVSIINVYALSLFFSENN